MNNKIITGNPRKFVDAGPYFLKRSPMYAEIQRVENRLAVLDAAFCSGALADYEALIELSQIRTTPQPHDMISTPVTRRPPISFIANVNKGPTEGGCKIAVGFD
jgi:hypothetical protein